MEMSKYDRATLFLESIAHIDKVLKFLYDLQRNGLTILMRESGFNPHPDSIVCNDTDTTIFILALEKEKEELEEAFKAL